MRYTLIIATKNIYFVLCFLLTYSRYDRGYDYWSTDFDSSKECEQAHRIDLLSAMEPSPCETVQITDGKQRAFSDCKIKLSNNLQRFCDVRDEAIWQLNEIQP